jgi:hypothetical protein
MRIWELNACLKEGTTFGNTDKRYVKDRFFFFFFFQGAGLSFSFWAFGPFFFCLSGLCYVCKPITGQVKMGLGKIIDWAIGFIYLFVFSDSKQLRLGRLWGHWFFLGLGIQNKRKLG